MFGSTCTQNAAYLSKSIMGSEPHPSNRNERLMRIVSTESEMILRNETGETSLRLNFWIKSVMFSGVPWVVVF
jgi:hypothetical protein